MILIAVVSLSVALILLERAAKSNLKIVHEGGNVDHKNSTVHMAQIENPGTDWLGRWW